MTPAHRAAGWLPIRHPPFCLDLCLESGQTFGWRQERGWWLGTIRRDVCAVRQVKDRLEFVSSVKPSEAARVLRHYFALDEDHPAVIAQFPVDAFLRKAVRFAGGLRILRQDPWECLAGFILSSTKQIIHIRQIWRKVSESWGQPIAPGAGWPCLHPFPCAATVARLSEAQLRACGMGFRAPYLLGAARRVADGGLDLESLRRLPTAGARDRLMALPGVGPKIANCVLLFSLDKADAFPVDTWIMKVLRAVYFRGKRRVSPARLIGFSAAHFGPYAGHAQQYLFHYARLNPLRLAMPGRS